MRQEETAEAGGSVKTGPRVKKLKKPKATVSTEEVRAQIEEAGSMKRTVDMSEVRKSLELWVEGAVKEIGRLTDKKAIEIISRKEFEELKKRDPSMRVYPAKLVCTESLNETKEGTEIVRDIKRKVRIVACGNFALSDGEATFSATPDITALRTILRLAAFARREGRQVRVASTDVSVAFLNAPLQTGYVVGITPPAVLVKMGLMDDGEVWLLSRALYGLRESPRAWSMERDKVLQQLSFTWKGHAAWLEQCKSEPGVWRVRVGTLNERRSSILRAASPFNDVEGEGLIVKGCAWIDRLDDALSGLGENFGIKPELIGWVLAYVDDLLMVTWKDVENGEQEEGEKFPGDKLQEEVETRWKCGKSQILTPEAPLEYTGIEVREFDEEYHVSQLKYTRSLLAKHGMLKNAKKSDIIFDANECEEETKLEEYAEQLPKKEGKEKFEEEHKQFEEEHEEFEEEDDEEDEEEDEAKWMGDERYNGLTESEKLVKRAQEGVGALIWLSKTRLDLVYSINRAAAYTLNEPRRAIRMFRRILRYLVGTQSYGLTYRSENTKDRDLPEELKAVVGTTDLAALTDISFAPRKEPRSIQMLIGVLHGAPVFWKSNKQSVSAQSTAEAELGGSSDGLIVLKGLEALFYELIQGGEVFFSRNPQGKLGLDNSAAVALGTGTVSSNYRNRHLKLKATGLVEATERGQVQLKWITGEQMIADIGTKTLGKEVLKRLTKMCNIRSLEELEEEDKGRTKVNSTGSERKTVGELSLTMKMMLATLLMQVVEGKGEVVVKQKFEVQETIGKLTMKAGKLWNEINYVYKIIGGVCLVIFGLIIWKIMCCFWYRYECKCQRKKVMGETDEDVTFWSPGGNVYHTRRNCRGLRAVVDTTKVQACRMCLFCQKEKKVKRE